MPEETMENLLEENQRKSREQNKQQKPRQKAAVKARLEEQGNERTQVRVRGMIAEGTGRGKQLVERYEPRIRNLLRFRPYPGTVNIVLDRDISMEDIEDKRIEHILLDGKPWIDARMAHVKLIFNEKEEDCWIIREETTPYEHNIIEIIDDDNLREKLGFNVGDFVEVEMQIRIRPGIYSRFKRFLHRFMPKPKRVMRI